MTVTLGCSHSGLSGGRGSGHRASSAAYANCPESRRLDEIRIHDLLAASDIHQHRPLGIIANVAGTQRTLGLSRQRQQADRDIGLIEKRPQLILTVEDAYVGGSTGFRT